VNKSGSLQGHELELIDAMKHSLSDGSEGKIDAKLIHCSDKRIRKPRK